MLSWRFPRRLAVLGLCGCTFAAHLHAAAGKPDYYAARAFGEELQRDFNERNCIALLDRLDREALRLRIFRPLGETVAEDEQVKAAWTSALLPMVEDDIQKLDHMSTVSVARVILLADGDRALECIFFGDKDSFRLLTLRLHEGPDGRIGICDLSSLGSLLETSKRIREGMLLAGMRSHDVLPDDEMTLQLLAEKEFMLIRQTQALMQKGRAEEAYQAWSQVSDELQQTPMGLEFRARLANSGSKQAAADLRADRVAHPGANPFAAYSFAMADSDLPRALAAFDLVLQETQQLAFLRGVKASLLLKVGRTEEALKLARDVCELTPINGVSYMAAVTAAAELQRPQLALEMVQRWHHVSTAQSIDGVLKGQGKDYPGLQSFLATAAYQDWLRAADKPVTKKMD